MYALTPPLLGRLMTSIVALFLIGLGLVCLFNPSAIRKSYSRAFEKLPSLRVLYPPRTLDATRFPRLVDIVHRTMSPLLLAMGVLLSGLACRVC